MLEICNSSLKYNNVDTVDSMMQAYSWLKFSDKPLFTVYIVVLQTSSFNVFDSEESNPCSVYRCFLCRKSVVCASY